MTRQEEVAGAVEAQSRDEAETGETSELRLRPASWSQSRHGQGPGGEHRGGDSAPSWLPWAPAAHFHLPRKPYSSRGSSVAPGDSCRSSRWPITQWATSIYMNLVKRSRKEEDQHVLGKKVC